MRWLFIIMGGFTDGQQLIKASDNRGAHEDVYLLHHKREIHMMFNNLSQDVKDECFEECWQYLERNEGHDDSCEGVYLRND